MALLPYVSFPTIRNGVGPDHVEGGLMVPFAVKLNDKFSLGMMTVFDVVHNSDKPGYHVEYVNSASLAYEWNEQLSTYYEVITRVGTRDPLGSIVMLGTGVTYALKKNVQLDAGVNFGVTRAADRVNPFVGISMRF
jgi:long-subunit fatty acid transport protein